MHVKIHQSEDRKRYVLRFVIVQKGTTPLLDVEAAQKLELIQVRRENICMVKPSQPNQIPLIENQFKEWYSTEFSDSITQFEGTLHLKLDNDGKPVQLTVRRILVALLSC